VSGGLDSVVLLDLLDQVADRLGLELIVAHVDHGIHADSAAIAKRVERLALGKDLPFKLGQLELGPETSETRARARRLAWLQRTREELGARYIMLAHQADDQAETVLMRVLRGSGPAGLAGIAPRQGTLVRPLLPFTRAALLRYARARKLSWWEDPANQDPRHLRSWLRREILPSLEKRLPDVATRLRDAGRHARADRRAWIAALRQWPGLDYRGDSGGDSVDWGSLLALPRTLRIALLQALASRAGAVPGRKRIGAALQALVAGQSGSKADLGGGWSLERAFSRVRVIPPEGNRESWVVGRGSNVRELSLEETPGETVWGGFRIRWGSDLAPRIQRRDARTAWFIPRALVLRSWREGDRLSPLGGRGRRLAVRCFQDARIPSRERRRWPIIESEGELAWIPGVCRSDRLVPRPGEPAIRVDVETCG
jgi:tRNA(Ile)-lysidine synthase